MYIYLFWDVDFLSGMHIRKEFAVVGSKRFFYSNPEMPKSRKPGIRPSWKD